jgi:cytosine deaminase
MNDVPRRADLSRRTILKASGLIGVAGVVGGLAACRSHAVDSSTPTYAPPESPTPLPVLGSAQDAAAYVADLATSAAQNGSYGIAGVLIDNATGQTLQAMPNRVFAYLPDAVSDGQPVVFERDPSAHGERQLVSWYLANRDTLGLPAPEDVTIVTSLDPCVMCASAILTAGVNVGVVASDTFSGVNFQLDGTMSTIPLPMRPQALESFGYYAVPDVRDYQGGDGPAYAGQTIESATYDECGQIFNDSAEVVRAARWAQGADAVEDPTIATAGDPIIAAYRVRYPEAYTIRVPDYRRPGTSVRAALEDLVAATPGATNAVGYLDTFGNLVLAATDVPADGPIATALYQCASGYYQTWFALASQPETTQAAEDYLDNMVMGTLVFLTAPNPYTPEGLFDIGLYGSTVARRPDPYEPSNFRYYNLPDGVTERDYAEVVAALPTLYSQNIGINPERVRL